MKYSIPVCILKHSNCSNWKLISDVLYTVVNPQVTLK